LLLRRGPTLGEARRLVGRLLELALRLPPPLLELDARIRVAIRLVGRALAATPRADRAALPARLGERVVTLLDAARVIADPLLDVADGDAVHHRLDAWNAARQHDGVIRLLLAVHPPRELDRLL